ncbi:MAG: MFS transporter [Eubacteriales bacterium]|nr:MFS transporter [Eubacteriales bacterium]
MNKNNTMQQNGIHRAHGWEMALFALNSAATNLYGLMLVYISYYTTGLVGLSVVIIGMLGTAMRFWDAVTDPFLGMILDKTNGKFGKNRPIMVIGNLIMASATFVMYHFLHLLPENYTLRLISYIILYAIYIIGYTCQMTVTKSAQSCLTNDPSQRPTFAIYDSIYGTVIMTVVYWMVANVWTPKYTYVDAAGETVSAFSNPAMFHQIWWTIALTSAVFTVLAVIGIWRKDRKEYWGLGTTQKVGFRDYVDVIKHNRPMQMLMLAACSDKLCSRTQGNAVVTIMLFGIICGNYGLSGELQGFLTIPLIIILIGGISGIASRLGQMKAMLYGTWGAMLFTGLNFLLCVFGDPKTFSFQHVSFFTVAFCVCWILSKGFAQLASYIVTPMIADCTDYEVYRSGRYVPGLMGTIFGFVDKSISAFSDTIVSVSIALIGFTSMQPTPETPYTSGIFWVTMFLVFGLPYIGWILNLIALKFYPLSKEKMEEIQQTVAEIKAKAAEEA